MSSTEILRYLCSKTDSNIQRMTDVDISNQTLIKSACRLASGAAAFIQCPGKSVLLYTPHSIDSCCVNCL